MFKEKVHFIQTQWQFLRSIFSNNASTCLICKVTPQTYQTLSLCKPCAAMIPWITKVLCPICGRFEVCHDCVRRSNTYYEYNRSSVEYNDTMREWLALYKYRGNERIESLFIKMVDYAFQSLLMSTPLQIHSIDCFTYIPLSEQRLQERGFNQAERFARGLSNKHQIPVIELLKRTRHTEKQSVGSRSNRFSNIQGAFVINEKEVWRLNKKGALHIVVIDDVYTTGSTLNECAKVITSHLSAKVYGATWAR
ncbi:ComF family protein [Chengkuizengella sediminis]|uniref:ComF family protein n=1 Tax=Chengkuizengella sediminis TaxID=1885917 RepID=UPI0013895911|nr:ComF family protein [Chengkuizengella sediminis]NDI36527.1 ComF family protein [Chengkuizengella sediminis]